MLPKWIYWLQADQMLEALKKMEKKQHRPNQLILLALIGGLIIGCLAVAATNYVTQNGGIPGFPDWNP